MDSDSVICKDPKMALGAGGKPALLDKRILKQKRLRLFLEDQRMLL